MSFTHGIYVRRGVYVTGRGWRYHRRLRSLVIRPRSRELLDRFGLIVGLVYVEDRRPARLLAQSGVDGWGS